MLPPNTALKRWLFDESSLTARLQRHCPGRFRVEVYSQTKQRILPTEAHCLQLPPRRYALVRQVHLFCGDTAVVFARTVIPLSSLVGKYRRLACLGQGSLGAMLFADKSLIRRAMEITRIGPQHRGYREALGLGHHRPRQPIFGRRSVFILGGQPLLVSEFFLPSLTDPSHRPGRINLFSEIR